MDPKAVGLHARRKFGRSLHLLECQLRSLVEVYTQAFDIGIDGIHLSYGRSSPSSLARSASGKGEQPEEHDCEVFHGNPP